MAWTGGRLFGAMTMAPNTAAVLSALAELRPSTLALMHGSSFAGDGADALTRLAVELDAQRVGSA